MNFQLPIKPEKEIVSMHSMVYFSYYDSTYTSDVNEKRGEGEKARAIASAYFIKRKCTSCARIYK